MRFIVYSIMFMLLFYSCTPIQRVTITELGASGREAGGELFVIKANGEKSIATTIKRQSTVNGRIIVDGRRMDVPDFVAFQNHEGYFVWRSTSQSNKRSGYFSLRLSKGKINLYLGGPEDTYLIEKEKGKFQFVDYESLSSAISDNSQALELLHKLYPKRKIKILPAGGNRNDITRIVEKYNQ
ncbi:MAG TPA: hypothetical protein VF476_02880 [Chitinophagaceae bacterium]